MAYLILTILSGAAIALVFKQTETLGMNRYALTAVNYLTACLVSAAMLLHADRTIWCFTDLAGGLHTAISALGNGETIQTCEGNLAWSIATGAVAGIFFFLGFMYYQLSVRRHGVSLAGAFIKLGVLVPVALSLLLWREIPSTLQCMGIGLAIGAMVLVNWPGSGRWRATVKPALLLLFLFGGLSEFGNKVFQQYGHADWAAMFLLVTFFVALLLSVVATIKMNRVIHFRDIIGGVAVGVPNQLTAFFLIRALGEMEAAVVYTAVGAGTIPVIAIGGVIGFGERLSLRDWCAMALIVMALVLIIYPAGH